MTSKVGNPFVASVQWTFHQSLGFGNEIHATEWTKLARDSKGRIRIERAQGCTKESDGQFHPMTDVSVIDPVARTTIYWTEDLSSPGSVAHIRHWPTATVAPDVPPQPQAMAGRVLLGTTTIAGVSADGWRDVQFIPAGAEGNLKQIETMREYWTSKELGMDLKRVFDDPRQGRSVFEVQAITFGEPDQAVFTPPAGYQIVDDAVKP